MTPRHDLQVKTRDPAFLWRMVIAILAAGVMIGVAVDHLTGDTPLKEWFGDDPVVGESEDEPRKIPEDLQPPPFAPSYEKADDAAEAGQWRLVAKYVIVATGEQWRHIGPMILAVLTGLAWMALLLQSAQPRAGSDVRFVAPIAGLLVGLLSGPLTLFFILWQEHDWGIVESSQLVGGLRYFILGVGLREETAKLLCFVPLLPWLVKQRDELAALATAGAVGLGFAIEENIGYIWSTGGAGTVGRLLNPAPIHMSLTGLAGLALYRGCRWPREWGPMALAAFGTVVIVHGLYDAFISIPALKDVSAASWIIFVLLVRQFFVELRPLQRDLRPAVSYSANFLACVCTVTAATFIYLCAVVGWQPAADMLAGAVFAESIMVYMVLRELPERLVTV
ncbi:MAG: PrsW family intramembrane metalloprotease [Planctomycetales bacterium]|nr:PrsW family intramembrane metalloprotease [Planctomycetales bacterium]